ncbi:Uncharacterised protein [Bacteroides thetaiotaomicron]|nr:Uncharacterised protein [Bacteroides thetaiotaomicron]
MDELDFLDIIETPLIDGGDFCSYCCALASTFW